MLWTSFASDFCTSDVQVLDEALVREPGRCPRSRTRNRRESRILAGDVIRGQRMSRGRLGGKTPETKRAPAIRREHEVCIRRPRNSKDGSLVRRQLTRLTTTQWYHVHIRRSVL